MTDTEREERARVLRVLVAAYPYDLSTKTIMRRAERPHGQGVARILRWLEACGLAERVSGSVAEITWGPTKAAVVAVELLCEPAQSEGES